MHQVRERRRVALDPDELLDLVVVGREVVVGERPVGHVRAVDRAQGRALLEIDVPEPGTFASQCTVPPPTTWGNSSTLLVRAGVEGSGRQVRGKISGLELGEVALQHGQAIVGKHGAERAWAGQVAEVVGALLEDDDVPAGFR